METKNHKLPVGIYLVAAYAIIAGIAELIVAYKGNYLGILSTPLLQAATLPAALSGSFYILGGASLLATKKRLGAIFAIIFIIAEILGRIYIVAKSLLPLSGINLFDIVVGTVIALAIIAYIVMELEYFNE